MKLKFLMLMLTLGVAFGGCTPDDGSEPKPVFVDGVNVENLLGTWDWVSTEYEGVTYTQCSEFDNVKELSDLIHNRIIGEFSFETGSFRDDRDGTGEFYNICEDVGLVVTHNNTPIPAVYSYKQIKNAQALKSCQVSSAINCIGRIDVSSVKIHFPI